MRISLGIVTLLTGCSFMGVKGSGTLKTEPRPLPSFTEVSLASIVDAEITTGPTAQLELTGDDNLLPLIKTEVHGDQLEIRSQENMRPSQHIKAKITVPRLTKLDISGTGDAQLNHIDSDALAISVSGTGDVRGTGHAGRLTVDVSGTGDVRLTALSAEQARVNDSGTGDIDVTVNQTLDANLSGTGDVTYHGSPSVTQKVSGSGDVKRK
jgi:hypothetical protein